MRPILAILHDLTAVMLAWFGAYLLRFNFDVPSEFLDEALRTLIWILPLQWAIFLKFGLYRGIWRYASLDDLRRIVLAVAVGAAAVPLLFWLFRLNVVLPRTVLIMYSVLLVLLMGSGRLIYRMSKEKMLLADFSPQGEPVLILGAGDAGFSLVKELARNHNWQVVGLLDDDDKVIGNTINGVRVLAPLGELASIVKRLDVKKVIVAMPDASPSKRRRAIDLCNQAGVKPLTVPSFDDLMHGAVKVSELREIDLEDLLGRESIELDDAGLKNQLMGKVVMVTGAGGSIGAELARQIMQFRPGKLVLFDSSELALYKIEQELSRRFPLQEIAYLVGDVRDGARLEHVFSNNRPQAIFHAAAYKHVPLMERQNAWQAVKNNAFGTWRVAQFAQHFGVEKFVLVSTDKAVNPSSVMGATKRLAEMICQWLQRGEGTRFIIVRFGNVLGSNGSVIPKFQEQIACGGPITVTHPEISRYFMSIPEAARLVMQASCMGDGGEIFVLDMGAAVKIIDLAHDMIRLSGLSPEDFHIEFTGLRPGEKLNEELLADSEHSLPTPHSKLRIAKAREVMAAEMEELAEWMASDYQLSDSQVREQLKRWIPEYTPAIN